jgi:hypothetical protein
MKNNVLVVHVSSNVDYNVNKDKHVKQQLKHQFVMNTNVVVKKK